MKNILSITAGLTFCSIAISYKENLFELNSDINLQGKTILLLDDLYSSGTTLNQATQTLFSAGASEVCVLALTKTRS